MKKEGVPDDGAVSSWMDRVFTIQGARDERFGESLRVASADPSKAMRERTAYLTPPGRQFIGVLSDDRRSLTGRWEGEVVLSARENFRRLR